MPMPRKGSARWIEHKLHEIAEKVEAGTIEPVRAKVIVDCYKNAYVTRISRARQNRAGESIEDHLDKDEKAPDLSLVDDQKAG